MEGQMSQDIKRKNRAFTLPSQIILVMLIAYIILRMFQVFDDDPDNLLALAKYVFLMLIGGGVALLYPEFKYHRGFKKKSPQYLIQYFSGLQNLGRSRSSGAWAYYKSVVYALYGEYDKAQICLEEVEWNKQIPMYQAKEYSAEALIQYLKPGDYSEGLLLAEKALNLCEGNINLLNMINRRQMIFVNIGKVLSNQNINPKTLTQLEKAFQLSSLFHKLIIAWALANGYSKSGSPEKSMKYLRYCEEIAPYCVPLHQIA